MAQQANPNVAPMSEVSVSNQRSVRKVTNQRKVKMPKVTLMGKLAKINGGLKHRDRKS